MKRLSLESKAVKKDSFNILSEFEKLINKK
jgi:hypothetical protein